MSSFAPTSKGSGQTEGASYAKFDAADAEFFTGTVFRFIKQYYVHIFAEHTQRFVNYINIIINFCWFNKHCPASVYFSDILRL